MGRKEQDTEWREISASPDRLKLFLDIGIYISPAWHFWPDQARGRIGQASEELCRNKLAPFSPSCFMPAAAHCGAQQPEHLLIWRPYVPHSAVCDDITARKTRLGVGHPQHSRNRATYLVGSLFQFVCISIQKRKSANNCCIYSDWSPSVALPPAATQR